MKKSPKIKNLTDQSLDKLNDVGFDQLDEMAKVLVTIWCLESAVSNGGFELYFYNSSGDFGFFAPEALRIIGANQMADLVQKANSIFGEKGPPKDTNNRRKFLKQYGNQFESFLGEIELVFIEYPDDVHELLDVYVENNL